MKRLFTLPCFYVFGLACLFVLQASISYSQTVNLATTLENRDIERFHQQVDRMAQGDVDLLWVGDSIIHGWEGAGKEVWDKYYSDRKAMNFAIGGDRTGHVLWRIENSPMDKISPKMAIVMIGTNNIGHKKPNSDEQHSSPSETVEGIKMIVDRLKELYPTTKILLLDVFPRGNQPNDPLRLDVVKINEGLNAIYANNAVENVQLYDIGDLFLDKDGVLSPEIMPDYLHPNAAGYEIWAKAVEPMIADALGDNPVDCHPVDVNVDWWTQRFAEKNEILKQGDIDLLMVGDSITHFWDEQPYQPDHGFNQWQKYFGKMKPINLGHAGDNTGKVIWRLERYDFSKINPKAAVVLIGVNNTLNPNHRAKDVALGQRKVVQKLQELFPNIKILVLAIFPTTESKYRQESVDAVNELTPYYLRDLPNVEFLNINRVLLDKNGEVTPAIMPDLLHPNHVGYESWGAALYLKLEEIFNE